MQYRKDLAENIEPHVACSVVTGTGWELGRTVRDCAGLELLLRLRATDW